MNIIGCMVSDTAKRSIAITMRSAMKHSHT